MGSKDTFLFSILLDSINFIGFILFIYSACITIIYSLNLILYLFNFGSNLILTVILTYNRKIFSYLLILIFLNFVLSLSLLIFNFSFFNSFMRKILPQILLILILPKILNFNFNNL